MYVSCLETLKNNEHIYFYDYLLTQPDIMTISKNTLCDDFNG